MPHTHEKHVLQEREKEMKKKIYAALAAVAAAACILSACGPEPGRGEEENTENILAESASGEEQDAVETEDAGSAAEDDAGLEETGAAAAAAAGSTVEVPEATAGAGGSTGSTAAPAGSAAASVTAASAGHTAAATAASAAAGAEDPAAAMTWTNPVRLDSAALQKIEDYLNEDSSYGFLLSAYERPEDIDLEQVFYSGAGYPREELSGKELERYLRKISQDELHTGVTKLTEDQIEDLLTRKAGISLEDCTRPLENWTYMDRYKAYYHQHGDTNQRRVTCTDGWQQGDTLVIHYQPESWSGGAEEKTAYYRPTYEAVLRASGKDYLFCSNTFWIQKDLIESQSYQGTLEPVGEVFFAPFYPDTAANPGADISFGLVRDGWLIQTLGEMEDGNVRTDRVFAGLEAVDFTDYNEDGCTDILTVCSYQKTGESGNAKGQVREARVYDGTEDGVMVLNREKTDLVNRDVESPGITMVTEYLTGKSDGKNRSWKSWKEAYADHLQRLNPEEYKGYALISLDEGRTPAFVQVGATSEKGATVVVYRNGKLEETWLNRQSFRYLKHENLLCSSSGIENLYYDTIYSITGGRLRISTQGHYGNRNFARLQTDENGAPVYQYFWDGGEISRNGYRDGLTFVFDDTRAVTCGEDDLLTAEEMFKALQ